MRGTSAGPLRWEALRPGPGCSRRCPSFRSRRSSTARSRNATASAAFNIVNDLTLEAVLAAAVEVRAPVIVQTSVKTVKSIGRDVLYGMWTTMTAGIEVPVTLHLDHCPEREVISVVPGGRLELGPVRRVVAPRGGEPAADEGGRRRGAPVRRPRRGRDRGHQGRRGRRRAPTRSPTGSRSRSRSTFIRATGHRRVSRPRSATRTGCTPASRRSTRSA